MMINVRKAELKIEARDALEKRYGFGPKLKDIVLLEADGDGSYIHFAVQGVNHDGTVPYHRYTIRDGIVHDCVVYD